MTINPKSSEEKAVYVGLKDIFKGDNLKIRQLSKIRALVNQSPKNQELVALLSTHSFETVCISAQALLAEGIFASEGNAETRFAAPATAPGSQMGAKATATGSVPSKSAPDPHKKHDVVKTEPKPASMPNISSAIAGRATLQAGPKKPRDVSATDKTIELEPTTTNKMEPKLSSSTPKLPYEAQHRLLTCVQSCLEHACFEFAQTHLSNIMIENAWDCPEAMELDVFVKRLGRHQNTTTEPHPVTICSAKMITSVAEIRHAAVHRHRLSARDIISVLDNAEQFLDFLGDAMCRAKIKELRCSTYKALANLDREERDADEAIRIERRKIDVKRRYLQLLEENAVLRVERTRQKSRNLAAARVARAVHSTNAQVASTTTGPKIAGFGALAAIVLCIVIRYYVTLLGTTVL